MDYFSILTTLISALIFGLFQQSILKKYNGKLKMLPLITAIVLMLIGGVGYIATIFTSDIMYFYIIAHGGFIGMLVCIAMLITYKANTEK